MTPLTTTYGAHRALVAALVLGVAASVRRGMRVVAGEMAAVARGEPDPADLLVLTDEQRLDDDALPALFEVAGQRVSAGVVALLVSSPVTRALVALGEAEAERGEELPARTQEDDAWAGARRWARSRSGPLFPSLDPARLARIVSAAAGAGLTLVEPETALGAPPFARVHAMRSPRARALLATVALGAGSRPLLFVPSPRAPKNGLARAKVERLADGWVETAGESIGDDAAAHDLTSAARAVLDDAATEGRGPLPFKEVLRDARERWTSAARSRGARATPSSRDAADLASWLWARAQDERARLFALDPADPGWELVVEA
jgi:hypothetical protein